MEPSMLRLPGARMHDLVLVNDAELLGGKYWSSRNPTCSLASLGKSLR